jgi:hypothetical protein
VSDPVPPQLEDAVWTALGLVYVSGTACDGMCSVDSLGRLVRPRSGSKPRRVWPQPAYFINEGLATWSEDQPVEGSCPIFAPGTSYMRLSARAAGVMRRRRMTEDEARTKLCPMARCHHVPDRSMPETNLPGNNVDNCLASDCMAWRWQDYMGNAGYCGLAGEPGPAIQSFSHRH